MKNILLLSFFILLFCSGIEGLTREVKPLRHYMVIVERNLFQRPSPPETPSKEPEVVEEPIFSAEELGLVLKGTVVGQKSMAVIEDTKARKEGVYYPGDKVKEAEVSIIEEDKVILRKEGKKCILYLYPYGKRESAEIPEAQKKPAPPVMPMKKEAVKLPAHREEMKELVKKMRAGSRENGFFSSIIGGGVGLILTPDASGKVVVDDVVAGSRAEKAGLKKGDVLKTVDGVKIHGLMQTYGLLRRGKRKKKMRIEVEREGEKKELIVKGGD